MKSLSLVGLGLLSLAACSDMTGSDIITPAPLLPGATSLQLDMAFFAGPKPAQWTGDAASWAMAQEQSSFADTTLGRLLAIPAATLIAAAAVDPVKSGGVWGWSFSTTSQGKSYSGFWADLGFNGASSAWQVVVSSPTHVPALTNYTLLDGWSNLHRTAGTWMLYDLTISSAEPFAFVQWSIDAPTMRGFTVGYFGTQWVYQVSGSQHNLQYLASIGTMRGFNMFWNSDTGQGNP
jgi:hypothetical protein